MEEIEKILVKSGLSQIEASTYLLILTHGPIGAGRIAKLSGAYRANVYQAIERLKVKGFVSETPGKRARLFEALSPNNILEDIKRKEKLIMDILPGLKQMRKKEVKTASIKIIEGEQGWRSLLNEFIESGKERVVYGIPSEANKLEDFFVEYHKRRAKNKLWLKHLFNYEARNRVKVTNLLPFTDSRYLPPELDQPVSTSICGSIVAITVYEKNIITFVIENESIAKAYRRYFDFLWKIAKR